MYRRYRLGTLSVRRLVSIDTIQGSRDRYRRERERGILISDRRRV